MAVRHTLQKHRNVNWCTMVELISYYLILKIKQRDVLIIGPKSSAHPEYCLTLNGCSACHLSSCCH